MSELAKKLIAENIAKRERGEDATTLDLGRCGLTDLAQQIPELFELTWLEELTLSSRWWDKEKDEWHESQNQGAKNRLSEIPPAFARLSELRVLRMGGFYKEPWKISDGSFLANLANLILLDLSFTQISDYSFLVNLSALTSLNLSRNQISDLSFLANLSALTSLNLSRNQISDLSFLANLSGLTELNLISNQISDIRFLANLSGLTSLYLSSNQISDLSFLSNLSGLTSLELRSNQISDYSFLSNLSGLTSLDLGSNQISDIRFLEHLSGLTSLNLWNNQLSDISFLANLSGLTSLNLSSNQIRDISFLANLNGLTSLDLSSNQIIDYSFLANLNGLTSLNLSGNEISDISFLANLSGLTSLNLSSNQIRDISFLANLSGLTSLELWNNQIGDISFLANLSGLTSLNLSGNEISDISFLANLSGLTSLNLWNNQISDLRSLANLSGLTSFHLSSNQLSDISFLSNLNGLTSLSLSSNQLSDYSFLSNLSGLTSLNLIFNQLRDISFLANLSGLTSLDLSGNQLSDISFLANLCGLTSLSLSSNQISDISFLANLCGLTSLDLSGNQISDISFLANLSRLTSLYLSSNQISDISFLANLSGLTSLDLSENQINDLTLLRPIIHRLQELHTSDNPIQYIPKEIYEQLNCAADLRAYWQSLDEGQVAINQQLKVMFLGNGCVGKTTLLHWFLDGAFRDISLEEGRTHGIIIQPYPFPGSEVMAHFWDFGGQEVYHATHRLFLGRRTLYLLVWANETAERSEEARHPPQYWLDMIADVADKNTPSSVLVIQNRFEGQPERGLFDDEQRATYEAQGLDLRTFSVDAKSGKGVKPLLAAIQEAAEELVATYQEQLPQKWVDIRSAVAERRAAGEKTLPLEDFWQICHTSGEKANAQTLLGYLHRAGELFHYDGRFGGQIILDQQWALKAVYAVLKRERIEHHRGQFRVSDLIGFWQADDPQLSAEDANTFLQFMLDNQTAFYAKDNYAERGDDPELIIPQLLPEKVPSIMHSLEDIPDRLQQRVVYHFLHRDIISRFIVRTAYLSEHREYWRQGIHIRYGQAKAAVFVEKDADGQPLLALVCYGQGKEELLQRIREELHKIRPLDKAQEYRLDKQGWQPYSAPISMDKEGKGGLAIAAADMSDTITTVTHIMLAERQGIERAIELKIKVINKLRETLATEDDPIRSVRYEEQLRAAEGELAELKAKLT